MKKTISFLLYHYILLYSFVLMALVYCLRLFSFDYVKPGLFIVAICLMIWMSNLKFFKLNRWNNSLYILFLISLILSGFNYFIFDTKNGFILFVEGIYFLFIPMIFFVVGEQLKDKSFFYVFIRNIILANFLICTLGLLLYFTFPHFYFVFLRETELAFTLSNYMEKMRMSSVVGSTAVGNISAYSIPLVFFLYENKKIKNIHFYVTLVVFVLSVILSFQRGAWVAFCVSFVLSLCYYSLGIKHSLNRIVYLFLILLLLFIILFVFVPRVVDYNWLSERINSTSAVAIDERSYQWKYAVEEFYKQPTGHGIGSFSHRAIALGHRAIPDGNYFRMLVEYGFVGFSIFLIFISRSLFLLYKKNIYLFASSMVFIIQALGSNVMDFPYLSCFFWFIIGCSYNKLIFPRFKRMKKVIHL